MEMRRGNRAGLVLGAVVVAGCLLAPGAASASSVSVVGTTGAKRIAYLADAGEANGLSVAYTGSTGPQGSATNTYTITDSGATVRAGAGCVRVTPRAARCSIAEPEGVHVRLGDRNDTATLRVDGLRDVVVDGGTDDDVLSVTASRATLRGGRGSDQLSGRGGGVKEAEGGTASTSWRAAEEDGTCCAAAMAPTPSATATAARPRTPTCSTAATIRT